MSSEQEGAEHYPNWESLVAYLVSENLDGWVFRGISRYGHKPFNKLERVLQETGFPKEHWHILEDRSLGFFKEHARAFLENPPADDDLIAWLSLMQHYGAPTRLTDWTFSPFVAIYFAYASVTSDEGEAALWMLNATACRRLLGSEYASERDHFGIRPRYLYENGKVVEKSYPFRDVTDEVIEGKENGLLRYFMEGEYAWPLPLVIMRPDKRMTAQQACFVTSGKLFEKDELTTKEMFMDQERLKKAHEFLPPLRPGTYIGSEGLYPHYNEETGAMTIKNHYHEPANLIRKITLPYVWRRDVYKSLSMMNITADTIFPGLDGAGRATEAFVRSGGITLSLRHHLGL